MNVQRKFFRNNNSHEFLLQLHLIRYFTRYTITRVSYVDKFYQLLILYNLRIILYIYNLEIFLDFISLSLIVFYVIIIDCIAFIICVY